jgi:hypothetical protein
MLAAVEGYDDLGTEKAARGQRHEGCDDSGTEKAARGQRHEGYDDLGTEKAARGQRHEGCDDSGTEKAARGQRHEGCDDLGTEKAARRQRHEGCDDLGTEKAARGQRHATYGVCCTHNRCVAFARRRLRGDSVTRHTEYAARITAVLRLHRAGCARTASRVIRNALHACSVVNSVSEQSHASRGAQHHDCCVTYALQSKPGRSPMGCSVLDSMMSTESSGF